MLRPPEIFKSSIFFENSSNGSSNNKILLLPDLVDQLTGPDYRYSQIEALEYIRKLIENGELILITDSFWVAFYRQRDISNYDQRRQRLADAWCRADEIGILHVLDDERKELEAETKLLPTTLKEEAEERLYRGGRKQRWKKKQKKEEGRYDASR